MLDNRAGVDGGQDDEGARCEDGTQGKDSIQSGNDGSSPLQLSSRRLVLTPIILIGSVIVIFVLIVGLAIRLIDGQTIESSANDGQDRRATSAVPRPVSPKLRLSADLAPCPESVSSSDIKSRGILAGVVVSCMKDGKPLDLGEAIYGKPTVLNIWAHWCLPCRQELPIFQELSTKAQGRLNVVSIHSNPNTKAALEVLTTINSHFPGVEDAAGAMSLRLGLAQVIPQTVFINSDGSLAFIAVRTFSSMAQLERIIYRELSITV